MGRDVAPQELAGGFKERGALHIHGRFRTAWSAAKRLGFSACLQDLAKAFDRISIHQAIAMLRCLGAPRALCRLLVRFYARCRRVFTCNKVTSQHWVMVLHGLLQGCPFSMLLIGTVMACWSVFVVGH